LRFWEPRGTAKAIIAKLNAARVSALLDPTVHSRLASFGQENFPRDRQTPQALGAAQGRDREVVADYQDREHRGRVSGHLKNFHARRPIGMSKVGHSACCHDRWQPGGNKTGAL
jgi:hypothetical protein